MLNFLKGIIVGIGGIAGKNHSGLSSSASIINCYNTGDISCEGYYKCGGGIVGYNDGATVENCYNSGKIIGSDSKVNGLIGYNVNSSNSIVTNCYYLDTCGASDTFASGKTDEQFASGEVTYLLNNSVTDGSQVWYQNIDNGKTPDDYPKFDGGTVYYLEYKDTYSNMCEAGINIKVIQDTLGHKDISTTMNIYADATKELKVKEFKELDMYLNGSK